MSSKPEIFICSADAHELGGVLSDPNQRGDTDQSTLELSTKLFDAQIVPPRALPYGTVRLHSTVTYEELPAHTQRRVTLVKPREADASVGRISVLSPIGLALLGHARGSVVGVPLPRGQQLAVRVVEVTPSELHEINESAYA